MKNGQSSGSIDSLIEDFVKVHKGDYLALQPYIAYIQAAYFFGRSDNQSNNRKSVKRSDGKLYRSMTDAGNENRVDRTAISQAIRRGIKSAGYYWKYA